MQSASRPANKGIENESKAKQPGVLKEDAYTAGCDWIILL